MSALKTMTIGFRCGSSPAPVSRNARPADADAFSACLDGQPNDAPRDRTPVVVPPALLGARLAPTALSPSGALSLRLANGPLAGLSLHARSASGRIIVRLEATDTALRRRTLRAREQLQAELAACFDQPITLEWPDASVAR